MRARPPRNWAGSSTSSSSRTSASRALPGAAMRPRPPALAALLAARLCIRGRRRRLHDVDELRRRLGGKRRLRLLERDLTRVDLAAPATPVEGDRLVGWGVALAL